MFDERQNIAKIQRFLETQGIFWDGIRKNEKDKLKTNLILAEVNFESEFVTHDVYLDVDNLTFKVYQKTGAIRYGGTTYLCKLYNDYSLEWIKYLRHSMAFIDYKLQEHPQRAKTLKAEIERHLTAIKNDESNGMILADSKDMAKFVETETKYWQPVLNLIKCKHCGEEKEVEKE